MTKIFGIDLGTTNSCLAILENGRPRVVPIDGTGIVPSVVSFDGHGILVGRKAWNRAAAFPEQSVRSIKRLMGTNTMTRLGDREYSPEDISAMILGYLKSEAKRLENLELARAVITVPAYFSDAQRRATIEAGERAGLIVERLINEPTAAALYYDQLRLSGETDRGAWRHALVYDLGGGTFDVSVLRMDEIIEVLASTGDTRLGGDDFDARLAVIFLEKLREDGRGDLAAHRPLLARLSAAAEKAKITLSTRGTALIEETGLSGPAGEGFGLSLELERGQLEGLTASLLDRTMDFVRRAISEASLSASDIDRVLLVGGMTRMPAVSERLAGLFGEAQRPLIDPDLAVAFGAAMEGGIISGENVEQILVDVTAHTLSLEALNPIMDRLECVPIIPRNTPVPATRSKLFSTVAENQKKVELTVYQGESRDPDENTLLGRTFLELTKAGAGCPVEVEYSYDLNGIVRLSAEQKGYSRRAAIDIDSRSPMGLSSSRLFDDEDRDGGDYDEAEPPTEAAGVNFVIKRARLLLEKAKDPISREKLAGFLAAYEQALLADSDDLDDLEDGLLSFMDEM